MRIQWRHGCVKLLYHGEVKVSPADIRRSLTGRDWQKKLDEYEQKLTQAQAVISPHEKSASPEVLLRLNGRFEARLAQAFLEKRGKAEWELQKPFEVCHDFVQQFAKHIGQAIASPWEVEVSGLKPKPAKSKRDMPAPSTFLDMV